MRSLGLISYFKGALCDFITIQIGVFLQPPLSKLQAEWITSCIFHQTQHSLLIYFMITVLLYFQIAARTLILPKLK